MAVLDVLAWCADNDRHAARSWRRACPASPVWAT